MGMSPRCAWAMCFALHLLSQPAASFTLPFSSWSGALARSGAFLRTAPPPTLLRSSVLPPDDDADADAEARRRREKRNKPQGGGSLDAVFDVPLADKEGPGGGGGGGGQAAVERSDNGTRSSEFDGLLAEAQGELRDARFDGGGGGGGGDASGSGDGSGSGSKPPPMNQFTAMVSRLSSTETIGRFMATAPPRVIDAMQTTVVGLMGNMGPFAVDSSTVTTSENLANLMFQLQMTGYMFKNADYRLSLQQSLSGAVERLNQLNPPTTGSGGGGGVRGPEDATVTGKITVRTEEGLVVEVDAEAYMAELRGEVAKLRSDLVAFADRRDAREEARGRDLIGYVNTLPKDEMAALTGNVQADVLEAMEALVYGILRQFGVAEGERILLDSSDSMTKLCLWQLVIGYNLRELEVREQFKRSFLAEGEVDEDGRPLDTDSDLAMGAIEQGGGTGDARTERGGGTAESRGGGGDEEGDDRIAPSSSDTNNDG